MRSHNHHLTAYQMKFSCVCLDFFPYLIFVMCHWFVDGSKSLLIKMKPGNIKEMVSVTLCSLNVINHWRVMHSQHQSSSTQNHATIFTWIGYRKNACEMQSYEKRWWVITVNWHALSCHLLHIPFVLLGSIHLNRFVDFINTQTRHQLCEIYTLCDYRLSSLHHIGLSNCR